MKNTAVKNNKNNELKYVKLTPEICSAVRQNGWALRYVKGA